MPESALKRRVRVRLGFLGLDYSDLLDALYPGGWTSTDRAELHRVLAEERRPPAGYLARLETALDLRPGALAPRSGWRVLVSRAPAGAAWPSDDPVEPLPRVATL